MSDTPDLGALFGAVESDTFFGLEACDDLSHLDASSAFLGVPGATPYGSVGAYCRNAPEALRESITRLTANVDRYNFDIGGPVFPDGSRRAVDCGDLPFDDQDFAANRAVIRDAVGKIVAASTVPIVVGGDDSVPIRMIDARGDTGKTYTILQLDAHIDWRKAHMGESLGLSSTMRRASEMGHITRIIQVGPRGIASAHPEDFAHAVAWGPQFVPAQDLHRDGVGAALDLIEDGTEVIVCLDVDVLDPSVVPGVIGQAPGGLSYYQTLDLIRGASEKGRVAALDVVEFVPELDTGGLGALNVSRLIAAAMGVLARQDMR
jgi:agmatinase